MENTKTTFRPILFSTPMVQAILENRKTMTRRVVKLPNYHPSLPEKQINKLEIIDWVFYDGNKERIGAIKCPYELGDVLWVRETHRPLVHCYTRKFARWDYKADMPDEFHKQFPHKWKPSIFMPKQACRIFLKIKSIKVERLRDIFHSDARAEGVDFVEGINGNIYYNYLTGEFGGNELYSFMTLWQSINGDGSWNHNPFVFVYEFEQIEKPLDFI